MERNTRHVRNQLLRRQMYEIDIGVQCGVQNMRLLVALCVNTQYLIPYKSHLQLLLGYLCSCILTQSIIRFDSLQLH